MKCPYCLCSEIKVVDSRASPGDKSIRRRRECIGCKKRFTTQEKIINLEITVIKNNGKAELFSREKLFHGIKKACRKRPVDDGRIWRIVEEIEKAARKKGGETTSKIIGEKAMNRLKKIDNVAYMRFASVYKSFDDINAFQREIEELKK